MDVEIESAAEALDQRYRLSTGHPVRQNMSLQILMFAAFRPIKDGAPTEGHLAFAGNGVELPSFRHTRRYKGRVPRGPIRLVVFSLHGRSVIAGPMGMIAMKLKHLRKKMAVLLVATTFFNATAQADVRVIRRGQENPMATIGKSTLYGAGTGLLLGAAIASAASGDSGEIVKWSFVAGTSAGFLLGIHHVNTRPKPSSPMFSLKSDGSATVALPKPRLRLHEDGALGLDMTLFSLVF